jgi:hypothetical protein
LTITEAAELTGLTRKAMARRVERGSVRSVLRSGRRLIPRSELVRVGLLPSEGESGVGALSDAGVARLIADSQETGGEQPLMAVLIRELVEVLQRQAGELAQYRALTAEAESLRLEREVTDLRVRLSVLEGGEVRRALERGSDDEEETMAAAAAAAAAAAGHDAGPQQDAGASEERLWLPPSAAPAWRRPAREATATPWSPQAAGPMSQTPRSRIVSLALEIAFIGVVAVLAWLAGAGPVVAASAVGVAWLVAATFELVRWLTR